MPTASRYRLCLACALLLAGAAAAQEPGQQPPPPQPAPGPAPGGPQPTPGNIPGRDPSPGSTQRQPGFEQPGREQQRGFDQRPIFLSGKVMLEDGTAPPEPATIERICGGQVVPEAYTDSRGRFSFQLGQRGNVLMDASVSSSADPFQSRDRIGGGAANDPFGSVGASAGLGAVNLMGCELRASLPGFRSEVVILGRRSLFDNPDVGVIILRRLANVQGTAISFTTLAAPKEAKKSFEKAQKLRQQKNTKPAEVAKELERAVQVYPQFAAAWNLLGETRLAMQDQAGARKAFEQSLAADGKYVNPYVQLAMLDLRASQWASAADTTSRLVDLNPHLGQAHYFNAIANYNLGKIDLAEKAVRSAIKTDEGVNRVPMMHQLLGAILARQGKFPLAAEEFRSFLKLTPNSPSAQQIRKQLSEWEGLGVIQRAEAQPAPAPAKETPPKK